MLTDQEQSALDRADLILEGNTAVWDMKMDGLVNGTYMGSFRFKCYLDPLHTIAADRERRELLGKEPLAAGEHETFLAYALTQLKYRIITAPPFWASASPAQLAGNLPDDNVIAAVLDAALGAEMKYKTFLKKKKLDLIERSKAALDKAMTVEEDEGDENKEDSEE